MSIKTKRELCKQIHEAYIEKSTKMIDEGSKVASRTYQDFEKTLGKDGKLSSEDKKSVATISALGFIGFTYIGADYYHEAEKYEKLGESSLLYFTRESKLRRILDELPVEHKTRSISVSEL